MHDGFGKSEYEIRASNDDHTGVGNIVWCNEDELAYTSECKDEVDARPCVHGVVDVETRKRIFTTRTKETADSLAIDIPGR